VGEILEIFLFDKKYINLYIFILRQKNVVILTPESSTRETQSLVYTYLYCNYNIINYICDA